MITLADCRDFATNVMGMCTSCCPRDSDGESQGPDGDRSRLINGEVPQGDHSHQWNTHNSDDDNSDLPNGSIIDSYGNLGGGSGLQYSTSLPKTKRNDEQSALADIVTKMASDVIDVNLAHATHTLEPSDFQERAHEYGRRLASVAQKLAQKHTDLRPRSSGLQDAGSNADKLIHSQVLSSNDTMLIKEVAARAREASSEFQIEHVPNLVGLFGHINNNASNTAVTSEQDSKDDLLDNNSNVASEDEEEDQGHRSS